MTSETEPQYALVREGALPLPWIYLEHNLASLGINLPDPQLDEDVEKYFSDTERCQMIAIELGKNAMTIMKSYPTGDERVRSVIEQILWFRRSIISEDLISIIEIQPQLS
jgi:hypothetical protein